VLATATLDSKVVDLCTALTDADKTLVVRVARTGYTNFVRAALLTGVLTTSSLQCISLEFECLSTNRLKYEHVREKLLSRYAHIIDSKDARELCGRKRKGLRTNSGSIQMYVTQMRRRA
jgi:hypothetical protein